jgi:hypothetical protein
MWWTYFIGIWLQSARKSKFRTEVVEFGCGGRAKLLPTECHIEFDMGRGKGASRDRWKVLGRFLFA